jgi:hypothetical protein
MQTIVSVATSSVQVAADVFDTQLPRRNIPENLGLQHPCPENFRYRTDILWARSCIKIQIWFVCWHLVTRVLMLLYPWCLSSSALTVNHRQALLNIRQERTLIKPT